VAILRERVKRYIVGDWTVEFRYRREGKRVLLRCIAISPLSPLDAEIIKESLGLPAEWSYDEETRKVELWMPTPRGFDSVENMEEEIMPVLVRVLPEFGRELSIESLRRSLGSRGWVTEVSDSRLMARRPIYKGREYIGYVEIEVYESRYLLRGWARVVVFTKTWEENKAMATELSHRLDSKPVALFPILKFSVDLGRCIAPEMDERIERVYRSVAEVATRR